MPDIETIDYSKKAVENCTQNIEIRIKMRKVEIFIDYKFISELVSTHFPLHFEYSKYIRS